MGLAKHPPRALEVGSSVDAMPGKAADDSSCQPADGSDVVLGLKDRAVAGDPGERVYDCRTITPHLG
jgi:hypothetical protein